MIKQMLEMIEDVDPEDTDKLDEIDAMVHILKCVPSVQEEIIASDGSIESWIYYRLKWKDDPAYTRSLDAIKKIQPNGWMIKEYITWVTGECYIRLSNGLDGKQLYSKTLPTEELARLHAVLQAIEWERNNG